MLSIEECRKILGLSEDELSKKELEEIRDALYQLSTVLINNQKEVTQNAKSSNLLQSINRGTS